MELVRRRYLNSEVRFIDTVCKPTKDRQSALQDLFELADTIVVVGGRASNNTLQLTATCRAAGKPAFHIERAEDLRAEWFASTGTIGLTAGTSTLLETVEAVRLRLEEISCNSNQPPT